MESEKLDGKTWVEMISYHLLERMYWWYTGQNN